MKAEDITVDVRLTSKEGSKIKAFADVSIPFGSDGVITIFGFSILHGDSRPARVMAPARKGAKAWFPVIELTGRVRQLLESTVLAKYEQALETTDHEMH